MDDPQLEIKIWLRDELDRRGRTTRKALAKYLKLGPDQITRMTNISDVGEKRNIRAHELNKMKEFFVELDNSKVITESEIGKDPVNTKDINASTTQGDLHSGRLFMGPIDYTRMLFDLERQVTDLRDAFEKMQIRLGESGIEGDTLTPHQRVRK